MKEFKSSCPDNDDECRKKLAEYVHSLSKEDCAALRESCAPCERDIDGMKACMIGMAPGLVALLLEDHDCAMLMPADAYGEAWK